MSRFVGYLYAIGYEGRELVSYHWHPSGNSPITRPHMHVGADVQVGDRWLGKVHLPTGAVGLEQVVALAIVELGVEPLRDDWERLIRRGRRPLTLAWHAQPRQWGAERLPPLRAIRWRLQRAASARTRTWRPLQSEPTDDEAAP